MDLVLIVGGTVLFWKLVGAPLERWLKTVVGIRIIGRSGDTVPDR